MEKGLKLGIVVGVFLLAAVWYFFPVGGETLARNVFRMRLALPATVLAFGSIGLVPGLMSVGFLFCTVGDALGVSGSFEGQIAGFAVAQICFISQFVRDVRRGSGKTQGSSGNARNTSGKTQGSSGNARNSSGKRRWTAFIVAGVVCVIPLVFAGLNIMPGVKSLPLRIGCIVYAMLLTGSLFTSIVRCYSVGRYVAMIGCGVFLVSDFIIAWNKFTEHIPHAGVYIMITYYVALLLIFLGSLRLVSRNGKEEQGMF